MKFLMKAAMSGLVEARFGGAEEARFGGQFRYFDVVVEDLTVE